MSSLLFSCVHCCVFSLDVAFGCDCLARYSICQKPLPLALVALVDLFRHEQTILTTNESRGSWNEVGWVGLGAVPSSLSSCRLLLLLLLHCVCCVLGLSVSSEGLLPDFCLLLGSLRASVGGNVSVHR